MPSSLNNFMFAIGPYIEYWTSWFLRMRKAGPSKIFKMSDVVSFSLNLSCDEEEKSINSIPNDSQLGPMGDIVVKGPFTNLDPSQETTYDQEAFTPKSNNRFYTVSDKELDFIVSQATASSTKDQTKWAVKIFKGKHIVVIIFWPYINLFLQWRIT